MDAPEPVTRSRMDRIWPFLSLIPLGLGAWAPIYAGYRTRRPAWVLAGVLCTAVVLTGLMIPHAEDGDNSFAGGFIIIGWAAAMAVSFSLRGAFDRRMSSPWHAALEQGRSRLEQREAALQLVASDPALAAEVGIGRARTGPTGSGPGWST